MQRIKLALVQPEGEKQIKTVFIYLSAQTLPEEKSWLYSYVFDSTVNWEFTGKWLHVCQLLKKGEEEEEEEEEKHVGGGGGEGGGRMKKRGKKKMLKKKKKKKKEVEEEEEKKKQKLEEGEK